MSIHYHIDGVKITFRFEGRFSLSEQLELVSRGYREWKPEHSVVGILIDVSRSQESRSHDELREFARRICHGHQGRHMKIGILVEDALHFGLARVFSVFCESDQSEVFISTDPGELDDWFVKKLA